MPQIVIWVMEPFASFKNIVLVKAIKIGLEIFLKTTLTRTENFALSQRKHGPYGPDYFIYGIFLLILQDYSLNMALICGKYVLIIKHQTVFLWVSCMTFQ